MNVILVLPDLMHDMKVKHAMLILKSYYSHLLGYITINSHLLGYIQPPKFHISTFSTTSIQILLRERNMYVAVKIFFQLEKLGDINDMVSSSQDHGVIPDCTIDIQVVC